MGSQSHLGVVRARALIAQIETLSRESIEKAGEVDCSRIAAALDDALDDLSTRPMLMLYLAAYLSRCVTGSVPDHRLWTPPFL